MVTVVLAVICVTLLGLELLWRPSKPRRRRRHLAEMQRDFHRQRERLEAKFVQFGLRAHGSTGPHWVDCEFEDDVSYAKHRASGDLSAFVGVTVIVTPDDDLDAAEQHVCEATAIFRFDGDHWETDGHAIFNLTPTEAIRFYHTEFKLVGQELAARP